MSRRQLVRGEPLYLDRSFRAASSGSGLKLTVAVSAAAAAIRVCWISSDLARRTAAVAMFYKQWLTTGPARG